MMRPTTDAWTPETEAQSNWRRAHMWRTIRHALAYAVPATAGLIVVVVGFMAVMP